MPLALPVSPLHDIPGHWRSQWHTFSKPVAHFFKASGALFQQSGSLLYGKAGWDIVPGAPHAAPQLFDPHELQHEPLQGSQQESQHGSTTMHGSVTITFRSGWNREFQAYFQHSATRHPLRPPSITINTANSKYFFMLASLIPIMAWARKWFPAQASLRPERRNTARMNWTAGKRRCRPALPSDTPDLATSSSRTGIPRRPTGASLQPLKSVTSSLHILPSKWSRSFAILFAKKLYTTIDDVQMQRLSFLGNIMFNFSDRACCLCATFSIKGAKIVLLDGYSDPVHNDANG